MTTRTRIAVAAGTAGLLGGLALGVTGVATAADPATSPTQDQQSLQQRPMHDGRGGPMGMGDRMGMGMGMGDRMGKGGHHGRGGGLVTAVDADSLTVNTHDGIKTVALTGSTTYYEGRTKATRAAVDVGDVVGVRLVDPAATSPVASVVVVRLAHVAGWVTAVDGSTITLKDVDGFTRTVRTTNSTDWYDDGSESSSSIAKVGAFVRAHGTVASDGTTLQAARVATGTPQRGQDAPAA